MGFAKDAFGDLLVSLQRRVQSLEHQSPSGKILPFDMTIVDSDVGHPPSFDAEYYRHADKVDAWFSTSFDSTFVSGSTPWYLGIPWTLRPATIGLARLIGRWRGLHSGTVSEGQIFTAGTNRVYLWFVEDPVGGVGSHTQLGPNAPWTWMAGDFLEGQFTAHILPGY